MYLVITITKMNADSFKYLDSNYLGVILLPPGESRNVQDIFPEGVLLLREAHFNRYKQCHRSDVYKEM
jgi:hypothetical protein